MALSDFLPRKKSKTLGQGISWRDFVEKDDDFLKDLLGPTSLNFIDLISKYAKSVEIDKNNPSKIATLSEMKCKNLFEHEGVVYGLNEEQRGEICLILKKLGFYMLAVEAHKKHAEKPDSRGFIFNDPSVTMYEFYEQARQVIESEDNREALISKTLENNDGNKSENNFSEDKEVIYTKLVKDFNLEGLPEEDKEDMLLEITKAIQKQFLFDVYDLLGGDTFEALQSSAKMGVEFYNTTLKHLVPNYNEVFQKSREKVVKAFNAQ